MKRLVAAIYLITILPACTSTYYLIEPKDDYEIYEGRKVITAERDSLEVSLNFEGYGEGNSYFLLYAVNNGTEEKSISPENIELNILTAETPDLIGKTIPAYNPEDEIDLLNEQESALETGHTIASSLNCLFATVSVLASTVDDDEESDPLGEAGYWLGKINEEHESYKYQKANIKISKQFWEDEAFRISTLEQGFDAGGIIVFPSINEMRLFVVTIKADKTLFKFYFEQKKIEE